MGYGTAGKVENMAETRFTLMPGDGAATKALTTLGSAIRKVEAIKSVSEIADYNHALIIQDSTGKTLESLWHIEEQNIFEYYKGSQMIIWRWKGMTPELYQKGIAAVMPFKGDLYPWYRLFWHLLGIAPFVHLRNVPVCSELYEQFILTCGAVMTEGKNWWGTTPQEIVNEVRISKYFDVIFEGVI
jgi:hypothetical protein